MDTVFWIYKWIIQPLVRVATNLLVSAVWAGIGAGIIALFGGQDLLASAGSGFGAGFGWSFTPAGAVIAIVFGIMGGVHGWKMAAAETYDSVGGFIAFLVDNTWSLPNSIVGSAWATVTVGIPTDSLSKGSGSLYLQNGVFGSYDTTLGNVTAGTIVPTHEFVHVIQARVCGPFFYPIFVANYIVNLVPYWLLIKWIFNVYPAAPITSFGEYFTRGVYPFTIFELMAYGVQGSPQLRPTRAA
jgi:hypothetical protein